MLYEKETGRTIDEVASKLDEAARANQFGAIGFHGIKRKSQAECRGFEVCNPQEAKTVLEEEDLL